jgi:hypothetical protein
MGERWWKKNKLPANLSDQFLVPECHDLDWSQGILNKWLKVECQSVLAVVQKYITCEGRFSTIHCYHMRFLMHLNGNHEMNFPFYLLKRLTKMAKRIQSQPKTIHKILFHQGIIKILVIYALREVQVSCKQLLSSLISKNMVQKHKRQLLKRKPGFQQERAVQQRYKKLLL